MLLNFQNSTEIQEKELSCDFGYGEMKNFSSKCLVCGQFHNTEDHWKFMADMPSKPDSLIADLMKMGAYNQQALDIADSISKADLQKALFLKMAGQGNAKRERLVNELIKQAGGLNEAFAAAFGHKSDEFFNDAIRSGGFTRRRFLRNVAIGAALVTLASCNNSNQAPEATTEGQPVDTSSLEKTDLTVAFLPITCASPIIMSDPLGFYKKHGLNVELRKYASWSVVRDAAIAGELDAYHMLAPMPIAMSLGLGSTAFPVKLASIENNNGQGIAVANKHKGKVKSAADFKGFTIGIPYDYSNHNLILRYYLAAGGVNPDRDIKTIVLPPPDAIAKMATGQIDAFILPDNFTQRVVHDDIGFIHILTKDIWESHPCCAFTASNEWIDSYPNTFRALNKAIIDGANYANKPENRKEIAAAIAPRQYLNQPVEVLEAVMTGKFDDGQGNSLDIPDRIKFDPYPWKSFATWISTQLVRWDYLPEEKANYQQIGEQIFLTDLARELAEELGTEPPQELLKVEKLQFDELDPQNPQAYLKEQIDKFGF
ncbi:Nitrate ABC transporter substrate-binding protein [Hyella patelloides LEGE 07179]|uniref:Nitrate ABC transporter substrate-binding protein n=1 Tax=Hyella patelloides LEGE 07179 TaxID=945734 RepID=A0A563VPG6_9CYAN|nr:CmpA/NrtA family ABC transporter substrate-binding protein [Hyella patelloides]VEP13177.1 Nitrate ABC transporter substrate-binding protein [Hyella patelloides LEGE 07179]